jgi:hypothetical protein
MYIQLIIGVALFGISLQTQAENSLGAISGGLAGSGRASIDAGESFVLNPAAVAHLRGAAITFGTSGSQSETTATKTSSESSGWHLSLNENNEDSVIASSIYLRQSVQSGSYDGLADSTPINDGWLSVGNFLLPQLSLGLTYHYHETQLTQKTYQEHNGNLGFFWTPLASLGVGFSFQDLKASPKDIPAELRLGSGSGIGLLYLPNETIRLRLDYARKIHPLAALSTHEWAFGIENSMTPWMLARAGFADQMTATRIRTQKCSFGLGFAGPRFGIHYGFQQFLLAKQGSEHSVDLMIPF